MLLAIGLLAACSGRDADQYQGYVEGEFVYVASSQAGRLQNLAVARGDSVARGAPLFALEATLEQAAQQQATQQLHAAEAQYADLQTGKRPPEIAVVRAQLAQAEAADRNAAEQLRRDQAQFDIHAVSQAQLDNSRAQADASRARVDELRNQLSVAALPGRAQQLAALAAQADAARDALAQADWRLSEKSIKAGQAGLVYETMYRVGEWVAAGNPVVRLLPPANIKIRFFVPETVVGSLRTGQAVTLHCDACAHDVAATVRYVSNQAEFTPPVIYSNDARDKLVFMVEAWPAAADAATLHPGQPVAVSLK
ncbi:HlyD family efflux transporter periplasmic adaptor subunit [Solimonas terrae]|uniref:HlyD family efflux transporter periplasmic adaptor subunit n=2 Tax=Solimonas terrae TaxID=1396819 RepID=A0A6M2BNH9_9GAMM|nr:HlyD family efflux transporter periplasmic adaptor subunit [Solimonas terrae]